MIARGDGATRELALASLIKEARANGRA